MRRIAVLGLALLFVHRDGTMLSARLFSSGGSSIDRLAAFHAALQTVGSSPVDILAVGDSITLGQAATSTGARWLDTLAASLASTYSATLSIHYPPVWDSGSRPFANPWSTTGSPTTNLHFGPGRIAGNLTTGKTMSYTFSGTGFDLYYAQGPSGSGFGSFTYAVDGGAPVTVSAVDPTMTGSRRVQVTGLSAGSHTVDLAPVSASVPIEGIIAYNANETNGIHLWNGGHGGYTTASFTDGTEPHWRDIFDTVTPDLVLVCLGVNDADGEAVPPATFKTNLQTLISDIRAAVSNEPSIALVALYQALGRSTWSTYVTKMSEVVAEDAGQSRLNVSLIDLVSDFGGYSDVTAGTYIDADRIHPTTAGHAYIAGLIETAILP